ALNDRLQRPCQFEYISLPWRHSAQLFLGSESQSVPRPSDFTAQNVTQRLDFLKGAPGADGNAGERLFRDGDRQASRLPQHMIEIAKQRAAAGENDTLVDDIGGKFRRGVLKRDL